MPDSSPRSSSRSAQPASHRIRRALLATLLFLPCSAALAQDVGGAIQGVVVTVDGKPVAGAEVLAEGPALQAPRRTTTDSSGQFQLLALPLGKYTVRVSHLELQPAALQNVPVQLGSTTGLPKLTLAPAGEILEQVEVVGRAPLIDPVSTAGGGALSDRFFDWLPLSRDYQSIAMLLPGVTESYLGDGMNIDGATGFDNRFFVDGADVTDPLSGADGINLPHDFIESVEIKSGGYQAEYRSALGGLVNVVTPSGADRLAGSIFGYWAGHQFSGKARTGVTELESRNYTQYDAGFSVGGPLGDEQLRYFLAYNPLVEQSEIEIPGQGFFPDESTSHRFAANLRWQVNPGNNLVLTLLGDPTGRDAVGDTFFVLGTPVSFENPDPYLRTIDGGALNGSLRGTHVLSSRTLLETSLSVLRHEYSNQPATPRGNDEVLFVDIPTGVWSGGSGAEVDYQTTQLTLGAASTWVLDDHSLKAGVEYRDNALDIAAQWDSVQRFSDDSYAEYTYWSGGTFTDRIVSLFVQDSWQAGPRLTLNLGLRWDGLWMLGTEGQTVQRILDQYQPRLGFVYEPGRAGSQRIYGSAARFYHELAPSNWTDYFSEDFYQTFCSYDHDPRIDPSGCEGFVLPGVIQPEVDGLRGHNFDEFTLGYERRLGQQHRARARAVYRTLHDIVEGGLVTATGEFRVGNPGRGILGADYPRPTHRYAALELSIDRQPGRVGYLVSYVLSESRGNYTGFYNSDFECRLPSCGAFDVPDQMDNADGLLPNDRTHVFKASGFYSFDFGLNAGASMVWQSGTPLNELGGSEYGAPFTSFIQTRGTAGRTPSLFDLNLRLDYTFGVRSARRWKPRLIVDVYHLFGDRTAVDYDQVHYFNLDENGNQIDPNPTYGEVTRYSPPTTVRLGLELSF